MFKKLFGAYKPGRHGLTFKQLAIDMNMTQKEVQQVLIDAKLMKRINTGMKHPSRRDMRTYLAPTLGNEHLFKLTSQYTQKNTIVTQSYVLTQKGVTRWFKEFNKQKK